MSDVKMTQLDRMRYTKDTKASSLILLGIVFNVLYYVGYYQCDVGNYYYTWHTGASIIYNLLFLLFTFLASESMKGRVGTYNIAIIIVGIMQFGRVFYLPARAVDAVVSAGGQELDVMGPGKYWFCVIMLVLSGICLIAGAVINTVNNAKLAKYMKQIEEN